MCWTACGTVGKHLGQMPGRGILGIEVNSVFCTLIYRLVDKYRNEDAFGSR
jgi:hypothetical protein